MGLMPSFSGAPVCLYRLFSYYFHAITIGQPVTVVLEGLWLKTRNPVAARSLYQFWLKIFAVSFGMGVVSRSGRSLPVRNELERFSSSPAVSPGLAR